MSNHMKFCSCRACRDGLHRGKGRNFMVRKTARKFRYKTKDALKKGKEPPNCISVGYTW